MAMVKKKPPGLSLGAPSLNHNKRGHTGPLFEHTTKKAPGTIAKGLTLLSYSQDEALALAIPRTRAYQLPLVLVCYFMAGHPYQPHRLPH